MDQLAIDKAAWIYYLKGWMESLTSRLRDTYQSPAHYYLGRPIEDLASLLKSPTQLPVSHRKAPSVVNNTHRIQTSRIRYVPRN